MNDMIQIFRQTFVSYLQKSTLGKAEYGVTLHYYKLLDVYVLYVLCFISLQKILHYSNFKFTRCKPRSCNIEIDIESSISHERELQKNGARAQNSAEKGILKRKPARRKSEVSNNVVEVVLGKINNLHLMV